MTAQMKEQILTLIQQAAIVYVSSIDENGYPNIKAMFPCPSDSLAVHYFSTNVSSRRYSHFAANPKASIYFCDPQFGNGLMLTGEMTICTDHETRARFWTNGDEVYYPGGVDDPDYCIFRFAAREGNYYYGGVITTFPVDELA